MTNYSRVARVPRRGATSAETAKSPRVPRVQGAEMGENSQVPRVQAAKMTGCKYPLRATSEVPNSITIITSYSHQHRAAQEVQQLQQREAQWFSKIGLLFCGDIGRSMVKTTCIAVLTVCTYCWISLRTSKRNHRCLWYHFPAVYSEILL